MIEKLYGKFKKLRKHQMFIICSYISITFLLIYMKWFHEQTLSLDFIIILIFQLSIVLSLFSPVMLYCSIKEFFTKAFSWKSMVYMLLSLFHFLMGILFWEHIGSIA